MSGIYKQSAVGGKDLQRIDNLCLYKVYSYARILVNEKTKGHNGVPPSTAPTVLGKGWYHTYHTIQLNVCDTHKIIIL